MKTLRLRNLLLPVALAAVAAVLIGIYVVSYRTSVAEGAGLVKVLVASRDIPAGTAGSAVASGGYLKTESVPRRAVVPGSVVSAAPLTSLVAADPIYQGQQITLRQFTPAAKGGVFGKFSGHERVIAVPGDANQLLAGTLSDGDSIDVLATVRYKAAGPSRASTRVVLRNLLVLDAPEVEEASATTDGTTSVSLVMTDRQAQTMGWAMKNATWFLALRPTERPRNSSVTLETLRSFLSRGMPPTTASKQILGDFPESLDGE
jgi:Flp pilus assembly protein CpaB